MTRPIQSGTENNTLDDTTTLLGWKSIQVGRRCDQDQRGGNRHRSGREHLRLAAVAKHRAAQYSSQPFVLVRVSIAGGTSSFTNGTATGTGMEAATSANAGFIMQRRWEADAAETW